MRTRKSWVSQWSSNLGNWGNNLGAEWLTVDDSVESIDWISGVLNDALGAVRLNQGVRSGHDISGAGFLLALVVSGNGILLRHGILMEIVLRFVKTLDFLPQRHNCSCTGG